jgi:hypothetical protein
MKTSLDSTKCADVYGGDVSDGKPLEIWDCVVSTVGARNESIFV